MKLRRGRLNIIEFVDEKTIRKIGAVQEEARPYRLKVEAWALSQAKLQGVNVPCVLGYSRDSEGREVLLLERIHGNHLSHCTLKENAEGMFAVGSQMMLLENASSNYGWINPDSKTGANESWFSFILSYAHTYGDRLAKRGTIRRKDLQKLYEIIVSIDSNVSKPYLINRDIKPSNALRDCHNKVWICDWENAILGDPLYDLAIFGANYGHGVLWKSLKKGYGLNICPLKYLTYEIIGLIGLIDFCQRNQISFQEKQKKLHRLILRLAREKLDRGTGNKTNSGLS